MDIGPLKTLLLRGDPEFWGQLKTLTRAARDFAELFLLSSLRKKAHARNLPQPAAAAKPIRLAIEAFLPFSVTTYLFPFGVEKSNWSTPNFSPWNSSEHHLCHRYGSFGSFAKYATVTCGL